MTGDPTGTHSPPDDRPAATRPAVARLTTRVFGPPKAAATAGRRGKAAAGPPELTDAWFDDLLCQLDEASARLAAADRRRSA